MRVALGCDDVGRPLLDILRPFLLTQPGVEVVDLSTPLNAAVEHYPDVAERVALAVRDGGYDRGLLICGTGIGMAISACKVPGMRAAVCHDSYSAERARRSNNAQILALGARVIGDELAKAVVHVWLCAEFDENGSSAPNVARLAELDRRYSGGA